MIFARIQAGAVGKIALAGCGEEKNGSLKSPYVFEDKRLDFIIRLW
jgi:hypothetical protein